MTATVLFSRKHSLVRPGACQMRTVTLPSFLGGREVRSLQEVQGSPAVGGESADLGYWDIFRTLQKHTLSASVHLDLQILLIRRLLLSLPWRHLDPEVKQIRLNSWQPCSYIKPQQKQTQPKLYKKKRRNQKPLDIKKKKKAADNQKERETLSQTQHVLSNTCCQVAAGHRCDR